RSTTDGEEALIVNARIGTALSGAVGDACKGLASLTTDAAGSTAINGGSVTTSGDQTYHDPVTLNAAANSTTLTGVNVTFDSTVRSTTDGEEALIVNARGVTTFSGAVGDASKRLASLTTDAAGSTAINGGAVTTTGDQTYHDRVTLDALGNSTTLTGVNVTFDSTVRSTTDGQEALIVNASGITTFSGAVGDNSQRLASLTTDMAGSTKIGGGAVTTTGDQT